MKRLTPIKSRPYWQKITRARRNDLIAYWRLRDLSGPTAQDDSGNGRTGTYTAWCTYGQPGIGDGQPSVLFDGLLSLCNIYSASLAGAFNGQEGTLCVWAKVLDSTVWTDGSNRRIIGFRADGNNQVGISRSNLNNRLRLAYIANGTALYPDIVSVSDTGWMHLAITWSLSTNTVVGYYNGTVGTVLTGLGTWAGALDATTCCIGAFSTAPLQVWNGWIAHSAVWTSALTAPEIGRLAHV